MYYFGFVFHLTYNKKKNNNNFCYKIRSIETLLYLFIDI